MKRLGHAMPAPPSQLRGGEASSTVGAVADAQLGSESSSYLNKLLSSIPSDIRTNEPALQLSTIPRYQIFPSKNQPRTHFDEEGLEDLAESIRSAGGIIQPIIVKQISSTRYEIIAGERRWRAAGIIDLENIPVIVRDDLDDRQAVVVSLIENLQRQDLNPIEEAEGVHLLIEKFGLSHKEAANAVGRSRSAVTNLLRLLELSPEVRAAVREGRIDMGHARAIASLDHQLQVDLLAKILEEKWSVRRTEKAVREIHVDQNRLTRPSPEQVYKGGEGVLKSAEARLNDKVGYPVKVRLNARGQVSVTLNTLSDLVKLLEEGR